MKVLFKADEEERKTNLLYQKRAQLSKEMGQMRLEVYRLEESWRLAKLCQKFLYQISPVSWREENDSDFDKSKSNALVVEADNLFGRYRDVNEMATLESLIGIIA